MLNWKDRELTPVKSKDIQNVMTDDENPNEHISGGQIVAWARRTSLSQKKSGNIS